MKKYTTIKVGYSAGVYGCSNEYFTTIIIDGEKVFSVSHCGLYGSDERINAVLKEAGYESFYVPSDFGKIPSRGVWKGFKSEYEAAYEVRYIVEHGDYPDRVEKPKKGRKKPHTRCMDCDNDNPHTLKNCPNFAGV